MQEKSRLMTREQFLEMLVEASCWEASAMESGFMSWCERHVPVWRRLGQDETWIRQRIETAQITRELHRTLKEQGLTVLEIREELRRAYAASPELYDLARAGEGRNTGRQRYTLRILIYETEKLSYEAFRRWRGLPMTGPDSMFREQPDQVTCQEPCLLKGTGLRTVLRARRGCCKPLPDQTQPPVYGLTGLRYQQVFTFRRSDALPV